MNMERTKNMSTSITTNESMFPPKFPALKAKDRVLTNASNKDLSRTSLSKEAFERQRENASKLAAGRSVVDKSGKENDVRRNRPRKPQMPSQVPQKPLKAKCGLEDRKNKFIKSESTKSLCTIEEVRHVENKTEVSKVIAPKLKEAPKEMKVEDVIPPGVVLIDKEEGSLSNEFLLGIYADDIYKFLKSLEASQPIRKDYLTSLHTMTPNMRAVLVDWLFEVQQLFKLLNETVHLAIALLDRFMQDHLNIPKNELQLVGVSCIFLASKYEEMYPPDLEDLVDISAKTYTRMQILKMEQLIFSSLNYQMGRPSPLQFLRRYGRVGKVEITTYHLAKYFIDLSLVSYGLCHVPPSLMAASALYLSLYLLSKDSETEFWTPTLVYYSQYNWDNLKPVVHSLALVVWEAPKSKFQTVQNKYLDSKKMHSVSALQQLQCEKLRKLALDK